MSTSAVLVQTVVPEQVRVGQQYQYQVHVTNLTNNTLQNVMVSAVGGQNATVQSATPSPTATAEGGAKWVLGDLPAKATETITVLAKSDSTGATNYCLSASFNSALCAVTQVVQPQLTITKSAPSEVTACDPIVIKYEVRNTGTGRADNVRVTDTLPDGLMTTDGKSSVDLDAGSLKEGESKELTVNAKASKSGSFTSPAKAMAADGLSADAAATTTVVHQPALAIECSAPEQSIIGREAIFQFTVKNTGDAASADTVLTVPAPSGAELHRASEGVNASSSGATWRIGSLGPGESKTYALSLAGTEPETLRMNASAQGACATVVTANCQTTVVGVPALMLNGFDDPDPVQIGGTTTYTLILTNQGTAPLNNVRLVCTMESDSMQFVSQTGATNGDVNGTKVIFAPIARLDPKAKATYKVVVKAVSEGQHQLTAEASSDEITKALVKTETTNFFK
jgi:uncharacterized repeat protein (TIGR01451 family)